MKELAYSSEERAWLNSYREEYLALKTIAERTDFLKKKLTPEFFNWRVSTGKPPLGLPDSAEAKHAIKELTGWVYNNWRLCKSKKEGSLKRTVKIQDVVRSTMREAIKEELREILGKEDIDPGTQECFQQQTRAVSQVLKKLSPTEVAQLEETAREWNEKGSPPAEQRSKAAKHGWKRVEDEDVQRYRDMGMLSLTFVAYHSPEGQLRIRCHDSIAQNMGVVSRHFADHHEPLVQEVKTKLLDFVLTLQRSLAPTDQEYVEKTEHEPRPDLQLHPDQYGFPQLPAPPSTPQKHEELVMLVRAFLNTHYKLASGYRREKAPYKAVKADNRGFIDPVYIPLGMTLQDPGNLKVDELNSLLTFWREREAKDGAGRSFRWSVYLRSKNEKVPAVYGHRDDHDIAADKASKKKKQRKARKAKKNGQKTDPLAELIPMDPLPEGQAEGVTIPAQNNSDEGPSAALTLAPMNPQNTNIPPAPVYDPVLLIAVGTGVLEDPNSVNNNEGTMAREMTAAEIRPAEPEGAESIARNRRPGDEDVEPEAAPDLTPVHMPDTLTERDAGDEEWDSIDGPGMDRLVALGYPAQPPVNGPSQGAPLYVVPVAALALLQQPDPQTAQSKRKRIDQRGADNVVKKKSRNSNDLMLEEAQGILEGPSARANRSGSSVRTRSSVATTRQTGRGAPRAKSVGKPVSRR